MNVDEFWRTFLLENKLAMNLKYFESFYFGSNEQSANELLKLVLTGKKCATASSVWYYEKTGTRMPQVNDYSVVTDWNGLPFCIIKTTHVQRLLFQEMTYEICSREGEDETLGSWRDNHISFFTYEGKEVGYEFCEEMPILFEDFEVVYQK